MISINITEKRFNLTDIISYIGERVPAKRLTEIYLPFPWVPRCLQQYLRSFFCHVTNFNAANSEMFRLNISVTELLVLFHRGENSKDKQAAEEIHSFSSLKISKHELVWKQHTKFLNQARDDSKRYNVTKAFCVLKGRTDITWTITAIAR